jgi:hypothetical protein
VLEPLFQVSAIFTSDIPNSIFVAHYHCGLATWLHTTVPALIEERGATLPVANLCVLEYPHWLATPWARIASAIHQHRIALVLRHNTSSFGQAILSPFQKIRAAHTGASV